MSLPPDVDRGAILQGVTWSLVAVAFVFVVLRFWTRLYKRALGIDDWFMLLSWLLFLASAIIFHFAAAHGGGRHWAYLTEEQMEYQLRMIVINLPIAIAVTGIGKISVGGTIIRIFGNASGWKRWAVWPVLALLITVSTIDIFIALFQCGPPQAQWDFTMMATANCLPTGSYNHFNIFVIAVQTFCDYFFSILPMVVVWKLHMDFRRKVTVMFMLGLTLITAATATVKMALQIAISTTDVTWDTLSIDICYSIEAMFIIVFGSMPILHPLWEACKRFRLSSVGSKVTGPSKELSSPSYRYSPPQNNTSEMVSQEAGWVQAGDLELAELTSYPMQSTVTAGSGNHSQSDEWQRSGNGKVFVQKQVQQDRVPVDWGYKDSSPDGTYL